MGPGKARLPLLYQRQPRLEPRGPRLRFGTNTRIFRLNDYDFGQGTVPTVTYPRFRSSSMGWRPLQPRPSRPTANEPFNFLNLDLYAQDTWRVTPKLTWTFGVRDTFNSNPLNPHEQIGRLRGAFDSISHDSISHSMLRFRRISATCFLDPGCDPSTQNRNRMAVRTKHRAPHRLRNL